MLTPLWIGRACFTLLHVPSRFFHDPYAFAFGVSVCLGMVSWLRQVLQRVQTQDIWQWIERYQSPPLRAIGCLSLFGLLWFVFAPLAIGLLFEVTLVIPSGKWVEEGMKSIKPLQDWALGLVLLNLWAYVCWIGIGRQISTQRWQGLIQVKKESLNVILVPSMITIVLAYLSFNVVCLLISLSCVSLAYLLSILLFLKQETQHVLIECFRDWRWEVISLQSLVAPLAWPVTLQLAELLAMPTNVALIISFLHSKYPEFMSSIMPLPENITEAELQVKTA